MSAAATQNPSSPRPANQPPRRHMRPYSIMGTIKKSSHSGIHWNARYVHVANQKLRIFNTKKDQRAKLKSKRELDLVCCTVEKLQGTGHGPQGYPFAVDLIDANEIPQTTERFLFGVASKDRRSLWVRVIKNNREAKENEGSSESDEGEDVGSVEPPVQGRHNRAVSLASSVEFQSKLPPGCDDVLQAYIKLKIEISKSDNNWRESDHCTEICEELTGKIKFFEENHPTSDENVQYLLERAKFAVLSADDQIKIQKQELKATDVVKMATKYVQFLESSIEEKNIDMCVTYRNRIIDVCKELNKGSVNIRTKAFLIKTNTVITRLSVELGEEVLEKDLAHASNCFEEVQSMDSSQIKELEEKRNELNDALVHLQEYKKNETVQNFLGEVTKFLEQNDDVVGKY